MGLIRRKKEPEPIEPLVKIESTPAEWQTNVEEVDPIAKELAELKAKTQAMQMQTQAINNVIQPQIQQPMKQVQPTSNNNEQARIKHGYIREDGFFEWIVESNFVLGEIGEMIN